ncbi:MAG TPA: formate dehydrogenase accessory sulfurtransferase FdhD [Parafilimonas sp.]|nr:formate dehydrogenase accessory sulfurtransferase FdhD [Parafilimonas sp.]
MVSIKELEQQKVVRKCNVKKLRDFGKQVEVKQDTLAVEEPLEIMLKTGNDQIPSPVSVTMRTPGNDEELATGFLFTEGIIASKKHLNDAISQQFSDNQIIISLHPGFDVDLKKLKRNFYATSSCGVCGKESIEAIKQVRHIPVQKENIEVRIADIFDLPGKLRSMQVTFASTGGIHASALFNLDGNLLELREDVGRHNALDKLIGTVLLKEEDEMLSLQKRLLLLSGRASFELIQKAAMAGIPVVCSIGAPSSLAVETAAEFGMTLIGFLNNGNCNIYCGEERIAY